MSGTLTRAMVLAAGEGRRLRPLTARLAKPALPLMGRPLIEYVLRRLARSGIREVTVNLHHLRETVEASLARAPEELVVHRSVERELLGTAGGLKQAAGHMGDGDFVLVNADTLVDFDLEALARRHRETAAVATLLLRPKPPGSSYSGVQLDAAGRVAAIGSRERGGDELMFAGVWILNTTVLAHLSGNPAGLEKELLPRLIDEKAAVGCVQYGPWLTIDTPARYLASCLQMARDRLFEEDWSVEAQPVPEAAHGRSFVAAGPGTRMRRGVRIKGDVVLGSRCHVGEGADLDAVVCWDRVKIAGGARLHQCIVTNDVELPAEANLAERLVMRVGDDPSGLRRREIQDGLVLARLRSAREEEP